MLRCCLDLATAQAKPHFPSGGADPLHRGGGNDVVSLMEVMRKADDQIALTGCIACPGDLACVPIGCLDSKALDAVVATEHSLRKRPETIALLLTFAHKAEL